MNQLLDQCISDDIYGLYTQQKIKLGNEISEGEAVKLTSFFAFSVSLADQLIRNAGWFVYISFALVSRATPDRRPSQLGQQGIFLEYEWANSSKRGRKL